MSFTKLLDIKSIHKNYFSISRKQNENFLNLITASKQFSQGFTFSIDLYKLTKIYVEMQRTKTILKKIKWQTLLYWISRNYHKDIVLNTVCYWHKDKWEQNWWHLLKSRIRTCVGVLDISVYHFKSTQPTPYRSFIVASTNFPQMQPDYIYPFLPDPELCGSIVMALGMRQER